MTEYFSEGDTVLLQGDPTMGKGIPTAFGALATVLDEVEPQPGMTAYKVRLHTVPPEHQLEYDRWAAQANPAQVALSDPAVVFVMPDEIVAI